MSSRKSRDSSIPRECANCTNAQLDLVWYASLDDLCRLASVAGSPVDARERGAFS